MFCRTKENKKTIHPCRKVDGHIHVYAGSDYAAFSEKDFNDQFDIVVLDDLQSSICIPKSNISIFTASEHVMFKSNCFYTYIERSGDIEVYRSEEQYMAIDKSTFAKLFNKG